MRGRGEPKARRWFRIARRGREGVPGRTSGAAILTVALLFPAAIAIGATRGGDVEQAWSRVAQSLDPLDVGLVQERCDDLLRVAERIELRRLTPMALALVAKARTVPSEQAELLLTYATRLDPGSAEAQLALAALHFRDWSLWPAARATISGLQAVIADRRMATVTRPSALLSVFLGGLAALGIWQLLAIRRASPRLWHDLIELGARWRLGPNAVVLGVVVFLLPLFTAGDVVVLGLWVVALCWAYFPGLSKLGGALFLALATGFPTVTEIAFRQMTRPPHALLQSTYALEDHRYDPQLLDEIAAVEDIFGSSPEYHKLAGDLYRQTGLFDAAAQAYREGLRVAPGDGRLLLALGTVHYQEGDFNSALQAFQAARTAGADPVASNYNLSLTLAQTYHFRESDEAMAAARDADLQRFRELTRGRDHKPVFSSLAAQEVEAMFNNRDQILLLNRGVIPPPLLRDRTIGHPLTLLAFSLLVFAVGHFLVRERLGGLASACLRCGRAFCPRCRLTQESQSYCAQCVTMFLKKDAVAIDVQMTKRRQLDRHQLFLRLERRVSDVLLPGLGLGLAGRPFLGVLIALIATAAATFALVWLPGFVRPSLMGVSVFPLQVGGVAVWLLALLTSQLVRSARR